MRRLTIISIERVAGLLLAAAASQGFLTSAASAQTAPVVARNLVIHTPAADYTIPRIEFTGTSLSASDLTTLFDTQSPASLKDRLARLTAATITIPEITGNLGRDDKKLLFDFHDIKLTNVTAGKVASLSVGGTTLTENASPQMKDTLGAISVADLDLGQLTHVATEPRQDATEALAPILASFTIDSVNVHVDGAVDAALGKLSLQNLVMRAFAPAQTAAAPNQAKIVADTIAEALGDVGFGSFEINGVNVSPSNSNGFTAKLADLALVRLAGGTLDQLALQDVQVSNPGGHENVGSLALGAINLGAPLAAIDAAVTADNDVSVDDLVPRVVLPAIGEVALSKVDFDVPERRIDGPRVQFQVAGFKASLANYVNSLPTTIKASLDHLTWVIPKEAADAVRPLIGMGYTNLDISAAVDAAWDEPSQQIRVNNVSASAAGFGGVQLSGVISGAARDLFSLDNRSLQAAALKAAVTKLDLMVINDGIADRIIQAEAGDLRIPPAELAHFVSMGSALAIAAGQFMAGPKSIHVGLTSSDGIGAADFIRMRDPRALLGKINIVADANQPPPAQAGAPAHTAQITAPVGLPPTPGPATPTPPPVGPPPQTSVVHYFYASNGQPVGPLALTDLGARISAGALNQSTLVWREGSPNWVAAKDLPEVAGLFGAPVDFRRFMVGTWELVGPAPANAAGGTAKLDASLKADGTMVGTYTAALGGLGGPVSIPVAGNWSVAPVADKRAALTISMNTVGGDPSKAVTTRSVVEIVDNNTLRDVNDGTLTKRIGL